MNLLEKIRSNFKAKVLVPVLGFLVLVPMLTLWVVHSRGAVQFEKDARKRLFIAEESFQKQMDVRKQSLLSQFRTMGQDAGFKALARKIEDTLSTGDSTNKAAIHNTLRGALTALREEHMSAGSEVAAIAYSNQDGIVEMSTDAGSGLRMSEFQSAVGLLVREASKNDVSIGYVLVGSQLLEAISVAVGVDRTGPIGVMTAAVRISDKVAKDLRDSTHSDVLFLANGGIVASTIKTRDAQASLVPALLDLANKDAFPIKINDEHFQALSGALENGSTLGYVLLSSYEESLNELLKTQAALWAISLTGILLSAGGVWIVISRAADPLRRLRDKVEAVGRGDFTRRIETNRTDELGALARSFNEMTTNLQASRAELEKTVETLKTTQNQLIQREKLSAVGEFVAGVAHELNNPLTSLIGFAELMQHAGVTEKQQTHLNYIVKSSQRCHKIVQSLLSFARQHAPERKLVNAGELLDTVLELLAYEMRTSNIEILTRYDSTLPPINGDPHQLQQVVLNILNNARQAIQAHQPQGQIRIVTERGPNCIRILISDNGPGIKPENLARIFDPFFTTKPVGKGTGLGLSLCYGIIKEHGGSINVTSEPGSGATFTIELPAAEPAETAPTQNAPASAALQAEAGGQGKRILVIDDEEWILTLARKVLEDVGYKVDTVASGQEALNAIGAADYDLLVCDQKMPGLSGPQLYQQLLLTHPHVAERLIFMTGDVVGESFQTFLNQTRRTCITKPFSLTTLRNAVANAICS